MAEEPVSVVVYTGDFSTAGYVKGLLEDAGIVAFLQHEAMATILSGAGTAQVEVERRNLDRAKAIVQQFMEKVSPSDEGLLPETEKETRKSRKSLLPLGIATLAVVLAGSFLLALDRVITGRDPLLPWNSHRRPSLGRLLQEADDFVQQGKYLEAVKAAQEALKTAEARYGSSHPNVERCLRWLVSLYSTQGDYKELGPLYKRILSIKEERLRSDDPALVSPLFDLADLYYLQGNYTEAIPLYQRVIAIRGGVLGPNHADVMISHEALSALYTELGSYAEAYSHAAEALIAREKSLEPDHPSVATSVKQLAYCAERLGKYETAQAFYERLLKMREQRFRQNHPAVAAVLVAVSSS